mgnify:CR=1 FL=1
MKFFTFILLIGIICTACFVMPVTASGGQVILNPTDDTYINMDMVDSNYGSSTKLKVCLAHYWTWLKFDLSSIPEDALGITAELELYTSYDGVTDPHTVVACLILNDFNNSWSEDTLTSRNHPPYPDDVELDIDYVANDETWYEWIVTEAVVNATANNATAVTILMRYPWGTDAPAVSFNSKEAGKKIPKLTIEWSAISDTTLPTISILSPQEYNTYAANTVPLTFTVNEPTSWIGYSLDGQKNTTITGNTTIVSLLDGAHTITLYANDTVGNMGSSDMVYFTVDTVSPNIEILSPQSKIYTANSVPLSFIVDEPTSWIGYSLDGQTNVTTAGNTTLTSLLDGTHRFVLFANDTVGNMGSSDMISFAIQTSIDTTPPTISIFSPENKTYNTTDIVLTFTPDEPVFWIAYSLDKQSNKTIAGNTTLSGLSNGLHSLIVYAKDKAGNIGSSDIVHFTLQTSSIDITPPNISIMSPENKTYATSDIPLTFIIDESVSWIAYNLDNEGNVTIAGNTTLSGLSDGSHSLVAYAKDLYENFGASETIHFIIDTRKQESQQADTFPSTLQLYMIVIVIVVIVGITGFVLYRKMKTSVKPSSRSTK